MKILHSADWHLDSAFVGKTEEQAQFLRQQLLRIPDKIANMCRTEGCDVLLLSGDLFDGAYTKESFHAVSSALEEIKIPVFISPGNHDYLHPASVYSCEAWPENVHIFTHPVMESVYLEQWDCYLYGAGYEAMDCPGLLKDFRAKDTGRWHIGVLHSDPLQSATHYCPITTQQIKDSGLDYLALGHVHKGGSFRAGNCLCAWPGCPMGRGYDEPGMKGVLLVDLDETVSARFLPMNTPRFYDDSLDVGSDAGEALAAYLPPVETEDFYRVTLTGYASDLDTDVLRNSHPHVKNLELRDRTLPEMDLWSVIGDDTLEGLYFRLLHDGMETDSEKLQQNLLLAAKISRQILDGQEVTLP